jgi:hypothetical protein
LGCWMWRPLLIFTLLPSCKSGDILYEDAEEYGAEDDGGFWEEPGTAREDGDQTDIGPGPEDTSPPCTGSYAYLHGDLWPMWYNMRMSCDPEHRAIWRCERIHGAQASDCDDLRKHYQQCTNEWPCPNTGVCAPVQVEPCGWNQDSPNTCDTRKFDYDSQDMWGTYYGLQWHSHPEFHRHLTVKVYDSNDNLLVAFSSNPNNADAYMDGIGNFGIGDNPQGTIQSINGLGDRFGSFACIRVPSGQPIKLWASWMNEFCHTCKPDYWSYPNTPCWTDKIPLTLEAGRHYLWTERGIEKMESCAGPPSEVGVWLPQAQCSTSAP